MPPEMAAKAIEDRAQEIAWQTAFAEANKTPRDFYDKHTFNSTYELTPGVMTGHRPDISSGSPAAKEAFAADPRRSWQDAEGRDVLIDALGLYQRPTQRATGLYTPPGGQPEVNPAFVARPLVDMQAGGAGVHPGDLSALQKVEATRAYFDAQGAGAGSKPILNGKPGESGSIFMPPPPPEGSLLSLDQIGKLKDIGNRHGLGDIVDYGPGGTLMTNFYPGPPTGVETGKALKKGLADEIAAAAGGREPQRAKVDSVYAGYEDAWTKGEGSGAATRKLFEYLDAPGAPAALKKLDADPTVRARVLSRMQADAESGQPVRADLQNARKIFAESGFTGLREALKAGAVSLPVAALFFGAGAPQGE